MIIGVPYEVILLILGFCFPITLYWIWDWHDIRYIRKLNEEFKRQGALETAITRHVSIHYDREIELLRWNNPQ